MTCASRVESRPRGGCASLLPHRRRSPARPRGPGAVVGEVDLLRRAAPEPRAHLVAARERAADARERRREGRRVAREVVHQVSAAVTGPVQSRASRATAAIIGRFRYSRPYAPAPTGGPGRGYSGCAVGRTRISLTSTCGGWETAYSTARAMSSGSSAPFGRLVEERRVDHARLDRRDADAGPVEVLARGLGHRRDGVLRRAVERARAARGARRPSSSAAGGRRSP